eukprot:10798104-Ditylum_brightwellii.AAC.1
MEEEGCIVTMKGSKHDSPPSAVAVTDDDNVMSGNFFRAQPIGMYIDLARQVGLHGLKQVISHKIFSLWADFG